MFKSIKINNGGYSTYDNQTVYAGQTDGDTGLLSKEIDQLKAVEFDYRLNGPTSMARGDVIMRYSQ